MKHRVNHESLKATKPLAQLHGADKNRRGRCNCTQVLLQRVYLEYILCLTQWSTIAQRRCVLPAGSQHFGNIIATGVWRNCRNQVKLEGRVFHRAWHQPWLSRWPVCFFKSRGRCVSDMVLQNQSGQYHVINLLKGKVVLVQSEIFNERNTRGA